MFESVAVRLLTNYLGKYVEELSPEAVKVGLWKGELTLQDVRLRRSAIAAVVPAAHVGECTVRQLVLKIPWNRLRSESVVVRVDGVRIDLQIDEAYDNEASERLRQMQKQAEVAALELAKLGRRDEPRGTAGLFGSGLRGALTGGFVSRLAETVLNNIHVEVTDVEVTCALGADSSDCEFGVRVALAGAEVCSADKAWHPVYLGHSLPGDAIRKRVAIHALSVAIEQTRGREAARANTSGSSHARSGAVDVLHSLDAFARVLIRRRQQSRRRGARVRIDAQCARAAVTLDVNLIHSLLSWWLWTSHVHRARAQHGKLRPRGGVHKNARAWWQYAGGAVLARLRAHARPWTWTALLERRKQRLRYVWLYSMALHHEEALLDSDVEELRALEAQLSAHDIMLFRALAEMRPGDSGAAEQHDTGGATTLGTTSAPSASLHSESSPSTRHHDTSSATEGQSRRSTKSGAVPGILGWLAGLPPVRAVRGAPRAVGGPGATAPGTAPAAVRLGRAERERLLELFSSDLEPRVQRSDKSATASLRIRHLQVSVQSKQAAAVLCVRNTQLGARLFGAQRQGKVLLGGVELSWRGEEDTPLVRMLPWTSLAHIRERHSGQDIEASGARPVSRGRLPSTESLSEVPGAADGSARDGDTLAGSADATERSGSSDPDLCHKIGSAVPREVLRKFALVARLAWDKGAGVAGVKARCGRAVVVVSGSDVGRVSSLVRALSLSRPPPLPSATVPRVARSTSVIYALQERGDVDVRWNGISLTVASAQGRTLRLSIGRASACRKKSSRVRIPRTGCTDADNLLGLLRCPSSETDHRVIPWALEHVARLCTLPCDESASAAGCGRGVPCGYERTGSASSTLSHASSVTEESTSDLSSSSSSEDNDVCGSSSSQTDSVSESDSEECATGPTASVHTDEDVDGTPDRNYANAEWPESDLSARALRCYVKEVSCTWSNDFILRPCEAAAVCLQGGKNTLLSIGDAHMDVCAALRAFIALHADICSATPPQSLDYHNMWSASPVRRGDDEVHSFWRQANVFVFAPFLRFHTGNGGAAVELVRTRLGIKGVPVSGPSGLRGDKSDCCEEMRPERTAKHPRGAEPMAILSRRLSVELSAFRVRARDALVAAASTFAASLDDEKSCAAFTLRQIDAHMSHVDAWADFARGASSVQVLLRSARNAVGNVAPLEPLPAYAGSAASCHKTSTQNPTFVLAAVGTIRVGSRYPSGSGSNDCVRACIEGVTLGAVRTECASLRGAFRQASLAVRPGSESTTSDESSKPQAPTTLFQMRSARYERVASGVRVHVLSLELLVSAAVWQAGIKAARLSDLALLRALLPRAGLTSVQNDEAEVPLAMNIGVDTVTVSMENVCDSAVEVSASAVEIEKRAEDDAGSISTVSRTRSVVVETTTARVHAFSIQRRSASSRRTPMPMPPPFAGADPGALWASGAWALQNQGGVRGHSLQAAGENGHSRDTGSTLEDVHADPEIEAVDWEDVGDPVSARADHAAHRGGRDARDNSARALVASLPLLWQREREIVSPSTAAAVNVGAVDDSGASSSNRHANSSSLVPEAHHRLVAGSTVCIAADPQDMAALHAAVQGELLPCVDAVRVCLSGIVIDDTSGARATSVLAACGVDTDVSEARAARRDLSDRVECGAVSVESSPTLSDVRWRISLPAMDAAVYGQTLDPVAEFKSGPVVFRGSMLHGRAAKWRAVVSDVVAEIGRGAAWAGGVDGGGVRFRLSGRGRDESGRGTRVVVGVSPVLGTLTPRAFHALELLDGVFENYRTAVQARFGADTDKEHRCAERAGTMTTPHGGGWAVALDAPSVAVRILCSNAGQENSTEELPSSHGTEDRAGKMELSAAWASCAMRAAAIHGGHAALVLRYTAVAMGAPPPSPTASPSLRLESLEAQTAPLVISCAPAVRIQRDSRGAIRADLRSACAVLQVGNAEAAARAAARLSTAFAQRRRDHRKSGTGPPIAFTAAHMCATAVLGGREALRCSLENVRWVSGSASGLEARGAISLHRQSPARTIARWQTVVPKSSISIAATGQNYRVRTLDAIVVLADAHFLRSAFALRSAVAQCLARFGAWLRVTTTPARLDGRVHADPAWNRPVIFLARNHRISYGDTGTATSVPLRDPALSPRSETGSAQGASAPHSPSVCLSPATPSIFSPATPYSVDEIQRAQTWAVRRTNSALLSPLRELREPGEQAAQWWSPRPDGSWQSPEPTTPPRSALPSPVPQSAEPPWHSWIPFRGGKGSSIGRDRAQVAGAAAAWWSPAALAEPQATTGSPASVMSVDDDGRAESELDKMLGAALAQHSAAPGATTSTATALARALAAAAGGEPAVAPRAASADFSARKVDLEQSALDPFCMRCPANEHHAAVRAGLSTYGPGAVLAAAPFRICNATGDALAVTLLARGRRVWSSSIAARGAASAPSWAYSAARGVRIQSLALSGCAEAQLAALRNGSAAIPLAGCAGDAFEPALALSLIERSAAPELTIASMFDVTNSTNDAVEICFVHAVPHAYSRGVFVGPLTLAAGGTAPAPLRASSACVGVLVRPSGASYCWGSAADIAWQQTHSELHLRDCYGKGDGRLSGISAHENGNSPSPFPSSATTSPAQENVRFGQLVRAPGRPGVPGRRFRVKWEAREGQVARHVSVLPTAVAANLVGTSLRIRVFAPSADPRPHSSRISVAMERDVDPGASLRIDIDAAPEQLLVEVRVEGYGWSPRVPLFPPPDRRAPHLRRRVELRDRVRGSLFLDLAVADSTDCDLLNVPQVDIFADCVLVNRTGLSLCIREDLGDGVFGPVFGARGSAVDDPAEEAQRGRDRGGASATSLARARSERDATALVRRSVVARKYVELLTARGIPDIVPDDDASLGPGAGVGLGADARLPDGSGAPLMLCAFFSASGEAHRRRADAGFDTVARGDGPPIPTLAMLEDGDHAIGSEGVSAIASAAAAAASAGRHENAATARAALQVGGSAWSEAVRVDIPSTVAVVRVPTERVTHVLAVAVEPGEKSLRRSRVLVVAPRMIVANRTGRRILTRPRNSAAVAVLGVHGQLPLSWPSDAADETLTLRFEESGWDWSGAFAVDRVGESVLRLRHADGRVYMLRVSVRLEGAILVTTLGNSSALSNAASNSDLSHRSMGVAPPYRIENFSLETVRFWQDGVPLVETLPPYQSCPYAWDEPLRRRVLVVSLAGSRERHRVALDRIREVGSVTGQESTLRAFVYADGPTRVLCLADAAVHVAAAPQRGSSGGGGGGGGGDIGAVDAFATGGSATACEIELAGAGVSWIDETGAEILSVTLSGVAVRMGWSAADREGARAEVEVAAVQIDNGLPATPCPVLLYCGAPRGRSERALRANFERRSAPDLRYEVWPHVYMALGDMVVNVDEELLRVLAEEAGSARRALSGRGSGATAAARVNNSNFTDSATSDLRTHLDERQACSVSAVRLAEAIADRVAAAFAPSSWRGELEGPPGDRRRSSLLPSEAVDDEQMVYVQDVYIGSFRVRASVTSAARAPRERLSPAVALVAALGATLANVDDALLRFEALRMEHAFQSRGALLVGIAEHARVQMLSQLVVLLGSADVLGNPLGLARSISAGLYGLFAEPFAAATSSPLSVGWGVVRGFEALGRNVVYGTCNALARMLGALSRGLASASLDPRFAAEIRQRAWRRTLTIGVLATSVEGLAGFVSEPVRAVERDGIAGLPAGILRGVAGCTAKPIAAVLDMVSRGLASVRDALSLIPRPPRRVRPPRVGDSPSEASAFAVAWGTDLLRQLGTSAIVKATAGARRSPGVYGNGYSSTTQDAGMGDRFGTASEGAEAPFAMRGIGVDLLAGSGIVPHERVRGAVRTGHRVAVLVTTRRVMCVSIRPLQVLWNIEALDVVAASVDARRVLSVTFVGSAGIGVRAVDLASVRVPRDGAPPHAVPFLPATTPSDEISLFLSRVRECSTLSMLCRAGDVLTQAMRARGASL